MKLYGYRVGEVKLSNLPPTKTSLIVQIHKVKHARRPVSESLGCHIKGIAPPHPDHDDPITTAGGVFKRFGSAPNPTTPEMMAELRVFTRNLLQKWSRKYGLKRLLTREYSAEQWIADLEAPQSRKQQLLEASKEVYNPKKHRKIKMFVKDEFYEPNAKKEYKYPRLINGAHDVYKCRVGPMFRRMEQEVFAKVPFFVKKIPVEKRMEYIYNLLYRPGAVYYQSDHESYETCFTRAMMDSVEFELYRFLAPDDKDGKQFLKDIELLLETNQCDSTLLSVWILATRMSGEQNTSLGNGFSNYVFLKFAAMKAGRKLTACVEGDDGAASTNGTIPQEVFDSMGLKIKLVEFPCLGDMSFCGLLQDDISRQNITDPLKILARFGWSSRKYVGSGQRTKNALIVAKALSYAWCYPHLPVVRPFCDYMLRTCPSNHFDIVRVINGLDHYQRVEYMRAFDNRFTLPIYAPHVETRNMVDRLYGITVAQQLACEAKFKNAEFGPVELDVDFHDDYYGNWIKFVTTDDEFNGAMVHGKWRQQVLKKVYEFGNGFVTASGLYAV